MKKTVYKGRVECEPARMWDLRTAYGVTKLAKLIGESYATLYGQFLHDCFWFTQEVMDAVERLERKAMK
jgi:hypothetical protein